MRKLLNKPWVVALLAFVALAVVAQSLLDRPQPSGRVAAEAITDEQVEAAGMPSVRAGSLTEALNSLSLPDQVPDPFAPRRLRVAEIVAESRDSAPDQTESVHLSAIWEQDGSAYILLNGRICGPGDAVGRITIAAIEREGVWLTHWKGRDFLRLGQDFTLITPAAAAAKPRTATHEG